MALRKVSVQKRRNTYYLVYRPPGSAKQVWEPAGHDPDEAARMMLRKQAELAEPEYVQPRKDSFELVAEEWFHLVAEAKCVESTLVDYRSILRAHLLPAFGSMGINKIGYREIQAFVRDKQQTLSAKRTRNLLVVLSDVFEYARKAGYRRDNPVKEVDKPPVRKHEADYLEPEELWHLIEAVEEVAPWYKALIVTAIMTGLRMGELRSLTWTNVDLEVGILRVRKSQARRVAGAPKTEAGFRNVPLNGLVLEELRRQREVIPDFCELVFPNQHLGAFDQGNIRTRVLHRALDHAGLRRVKFHSLRHAAASLLIHAGVGDKAVQTIMGHSSIQVTKDIYGHLFADAEREAMTKMDAVFQSRKPDRVEEPTAAYASVEHFRGTGARMIGMVDADMTTSPALTASGDSLMVLRVGDLPVGLRTLKDAGSDPALALVG